MNTNKKIINSCVNDIRDIRKEINLLRIEIMVIKSELLKDREYDKIQTSEATRGTPAEEEQKDIIARGFWWS
mgnify:CR=1 FL=1